MMFDAILEKRAVAPIWRADYKKWLRHFPDFCAKYPVPEARADQVRLFIDKLREKRQAEIKTRHYSGKTLKTYAHWSRRFQRFLKNKPPKSLSSKDVKEYPTYLAVQCSVLASTQNQAFSALLFLFRHALK